MYILVVFVRYVSLFLQWAISPIAQLFIDLGTIFLVEFIYEIWLKSVLKFKARTSYVGQMKYRYVLMSHHPNRYRNTTMALLNRKTW